MKQNGTILKPCTRCRGTGQIEVTGEYADTLRLLKRQRKEINGADLARLAGIKGPAMNNRLVALEKLGLAFGRWSGQERLWS